MDELLRKYDRPLPRYTSYPTVPFWKGIREAEWNAAVDKTIQDFGPELSLYVHVPYCRSLCSFCGCTKYISRDYSQAEPFVDAILRELDLKLVKHFQKASDPILKELHLGGGTPTWLPATNLEFLITQIQKRFKGSNNAFQTDVSIEVDPRSFTKDHANALQNSAVTRVSLGVQDFNEPTLKAIKREQSFDVVKKSVELLRERKIASINFDLVYGLPYQNLESMNESITKVLQLCPSRIALYSYAHVPQLKAAQKGVERHGLPSVEEKRALYEVAKELLLEGGYLEVGMDHFALPEDELNVELSGQSLHRNFMGYTIQKTKLLLGLGPTSLSDAWGAFAQNEKEVDLWLAQIKSGDVSPKGGHLLSSDDLARRETILSLMCQHQTKSDEQTWQKLQTSSLAQDGLICWDPLKEVLRVTEQGRPFIRNICAEFDSHLQNKELGRPTFSRSV